MQTVTEAVERGRTHSLGIRSPLSQPGLVWATLTSTELAAAERALGLRRVDPGGLLATTDRTVGPVTSWAVLGDNVIGATGWAGIDLDEQYRAVTTGAAAFIASAMLYLRVAGTDAGALLDLLSPRAVSGLPVGGARFCLFTTPAGTVDEEAVVVRTGPDEFVMSCGGGKPPALLYLMAQRFDDVTIADGDVFSFNIKGPRRLEAMLSLFEAADAEAISALRPFRSCPARPLVGGRARVLRTVIGYEVWADEETLGAVWRQVLDSRPLIVPAAWNLLNVYRVECRAMVFGLYPLDLHAGTTLGEIGCEWMVRERGDRDYVGVRALLDPTVRPRFWLAGLESDHGASVVPPVGRDVSLPTGDFAGYVTTAAHSPRHGGPLAFAHIDRRCAPGSRVVLEGGQWTVRALPFGGRLPSPA